MRLRVCGSIDDLEDEEGKKYLKRLHEKSTKGLLSKQPSPLDYRKLNLAYKYYGKTYNLFCT